MFQRRSSARGSIEAHLIHIAGSPAAAHNPTSGLQSGARLGSVATEAAEQRDAADEGRSEPCGSILIGPVIVSEGEVVRPSQLIASVGWTSRMGAMGATRVGERGRFPGPLRRRPAFS